MKKISVLLTFVALFIFYGYASAQNNPGIKIEGKVVDSVAGTALQLATITLKSGNNPAQAATTKTDGTFGFSGLKAGSYNLAIKRAGYAEKDLTVAVSGNTVLKTIGLSPDVKSLKEVQVRSVRPLIQQKPGKIIYDMQADPEAKAKNLIDILPKIPYITVDGNGNVMLKGSTSFKVFINGKPSAMMDNNLKNVLQTMPASSIVRIEVLTIPPAKYDAEGFGGIINIVTTQNGDNGFKGNLNVNDHFPAGGPGAGGSFTYREGKLGINAYGGASINNTPQANLSTTQQSYGEDPSSLSQNGFKHNNSHNGYIGTELSYEVDSLRLLSGEFSFNGYGYNGASYQSSLLTGSASILQAYDINNNNYGNGNGGDAAVNYQLGFKANKNRLLTFSYRYAGYNNYSFSDLGLAREVNYPVADYRQPDDELIREHTLQVDFVTPVNKVNIEAGAKAILRTDQSNFQYLSLDSASRQYLVDPSETNVFHYSQDVFSLYNSYQLAIGKWAFSAGARAEETVVNAQFTSSGTTVDQNYFNLVPSLSANYPLSGGNLGLGFNQRLRRPGINRLNPFVDRSDPNFITSGNPQLKASAMNNAEISYSTGNGKKLSVFVAVDRIFVSNLDLLVTSFDPTTQVTSATYQNTGRGGGWTFIFAPNYNPVQWYSLSLNNNLTDIMITGSDQGVMVKQYKWLDVLSLSNVFRPGNGWTINAGLNYASSAPASLQSTTNAWLSTTAGVNKEVVKGKLYLAASVNNPLTRFRTSEVITTGPGFYEVANTQLYFRSASVSLNYNFGKLQRDVKKSRNGIRNEDLNNNGGL